MVHFFGFDPVSKILSFHEVVSATNFHNFKFKTQFFATKNCTQVKLPELAREAEGRPALIKIHHQFQTDCAPEIGERDIGSHRTKSDLSVEREELPLIDKAVK